MACERRYNDSLLPFRWWGIFVHSGCLSPDTGAWRKTRPSREQRTAWQESKNGLPLCSHTETNVWMIEHSGQCVSLSSNNILTLLRVKEAFQVLSVRLASAVTWARQVNRGRKVPEEREAHRWVLVLSTCPFTSSCARHSSAATRAPTDNTYLLCPVWRSF